jgi:hypothetical protein
MNILDDLRAEWIAVRKSLGDRIAYLEAGNKVIQSTRTQTRRRSS